MKSHHLPSALLALLLPFCAGSARASIAYGSINNFDTVNDTGHECHGFEIELEDCHSTGITYTYNYNHYGTCKITEDNAIAGHPRCVIRWESAKKPDGTWAAYTAIPAGPIAPSNGHMFTNPSVNFGGEHFGVGYYSQPTAIHYNWLIDDGAGNLVHGGAVQVATPAFTYYPPVPAFNLPAQVVAAIQPPEPPEVPVQEFGDALWVKEIRTTTHNNHKVKLRDLVSDDPNDANDKNWKNGEQDEVEVDWELLQTEFAEPNGGNNGRKQAAPEGLNHGDEVVTRRYEFFKYTGPLDVITGEALCDNVDADGVHGSGTALINGVEVDLATLEVVGEFTGAQMAAVDVAAGVGLTEQIGDGRISTPYAARSIVIQGAAPFTATFSGALPAGLTFNAVTGILSGTPTASGEFTFTVKVLDQNTPEKAKTYTFNIAAAGQQIAAHSILDTTSEPVAGGTTTGSDSYAVDAVATVTATANPGYHFVQWEDDNKVVSTNSTHTLTMNVNHSLVAKFAITVPQWTISLSAAPVAGGTTSGGGLLDEGSSATVTASANLGYAFVNWKQSGVIVSTAASYTFTVTAARTLVATFNTVPTYTITTNAAPAATGTTAGGGTYSQGASVTLTASANPGYLFVNWTRNGNVQSTNASFHITVSANRTYVANFQVDNNTRTITTSSNPSAGGATSGGGVFAIGANCTVTATPNALYTFTRWQDSSGTVSTSAAYTFTVSANRSLTARFARIYPVTLSSNPAEGGATAWSGTLQDGDDVTVTATANPGFDFVNWTEGNNVVSVNAAYTFKANPARTLVANFAGIPPVTWTVSTIAQPAGSGTVTGGGVYGDGDNVNVSAVAADGYQFLRWTEGGVEVSTSASFSFQAFADRSLSAVFGVPPSGVLFDFDSSPTPSIPGAPLPLDQMAGGITANFSTPDAGGFTIGNAALTGYTLSRFGGKYLVAGASARMLEAGFDHLLTGATVKFSLAEALALPAHSRVKLTAYDTTGGVPVEVGSATAPGSVIAGDSLAGGSVTFDNGTPFNGLRLEIENAGQADTRLLCDNLSVIPLPGGGGMLTLANPNWNITLTDFGYSDFLFDNTPGFEGREYLSGEWGAAIGYQAGNTLKQPQWLEPQFLYPDWVTNSTFQVVMPITLMASNADGLPIAQSVIANRDLEITLRFEMLDTVTGMPMGVAAASAAGAGDSVSSNRYVLNQRYTVRNISGKAVSHLQCFQLVHGLTSQHGVFDSRAYAGKFSTYRYDTTLAGVDGGTAGAGGSSASGLEDYLGFSGSIAPTAFEIGHYGLDNVDSHSNGKPSDGVHLSVEDNWQSAPYSTRQGTDYFAPEHRWIAGAQRYDLPALADGESTSMDVMLSIRTGTTVQVIGSGGGGDHHGHGSCNGGSSHTGGVDFDIENVTQDGTFFGEESEADEDEIADRIQDGEFVMPGFQQPGALSQVWNLHYTGSHSGRIRLTFAYDPALIPAGQDVTRLTLYHFHAGAWEQMVGIVHPGPHTITISTDSLSPFMLGVSTPNAMPDLTSRQLNAGTLQLSWQGDTTGWILQENTTLDPSGWINSTAPVTQNGPVFQANQVNGPRRCFFRLLHP